ncbi:M20/M25/M40 family metallo-hydrolase [candidate division KSB1 bacterium]
MNYITHNIILINEFILIRALNKILEYNQDEEKNPVVEETIRRLGRIPDNKFTNATTKNTISITNLKAGVGDPPIMNVIPSISKAALDCRLMPEVNPYVFIKCLVKVINDNRVKITPTKIPNEAPMSPYDTEFFKIIEKSVKKRVPSSVTVPILDPYATDSRYFRPNGSICYGFTPIIADLDELSLMHSDNERVSKEEFFKGIELLYDIVVEFCV